jgi:hypothetical protein
VELVAQTIIAILFLFFFAIIPWFDKKSFEACLLFPVDRGSTRILFLLRFWAAGSVAF